MTAPTLFDLSGSDVRPRPRKRQRQTARAVYAELRASLQGREAQVLRLLAWHWNEKQHSPTALELLAFARTHDEPLFDVNSLRPRLTSLCDRRVIESAGKRRCTVSGKTVMTWRVRNR